MIKENANYIAGRVQALPREGESRFIGLEIPSELIRPFFSKICEQRNGKEYFENYENKWRGQYHLTLISSVEFALLDDVEIGKLVRENAEVNSIGLGCANSGVECCFFIVCESADLAHMRSYLGLPPKDFHITIGFSKEDLHGISKGRETLIKAVAG